MRPFSPLRPVPPFTRVGQAAKGTGALESRSTTWSSDVAPASEAANAFLDALGYDRVDVEAARKAGVPVANNGGANAIAVADQR